MVAHARKQPTSKERALKASVRRLCKPDRISLIIAAVA
jgi:hypothetical protein